MTEKLCIVPNCKNLRWHGPKGDKTLYRCEEHQKEQWRKDKAKSPKKPVAALLEDGSRRGVGRPPKDAPKPVQEGANFAPLAEAQPECVKVLVINRLLDIAQLIEVPVLSSKTWSDVRRPEELLKLLRGSGHVIVYTDRFNS